MTTAANVDGESGDLADSSCICKQRPQLKKKEYWGKQVKFDPYVQEYATKKLGSKKKSVKEITFLFSLVFFMSDEACFKSWGLVVINDFLYRL
jgi:hypothetical protein